MQEVIKGMPFEHGYYMPAEWARHTATWMSWPFDEEMWHGKLDEVRTEYSQFVKTIARFEPVHLLVRDAEARATASSMLKGVDNVTLHEVPLDDVWLRDNGPIFVLPQSRSGGLRATNWEFNSWGEKYEWALDNQVPPFITSKTATPRYDISVVMEGGSLDVNGKGVCLTTRQCLLDEMRNPIMCRKDIEKVLRDFLGINQVIWLNLGLEGDHTDGHVDTITRFVDEETILTSVTGDTNDVNYERMQENLTILRAARTPDGNPFRVIELPLPTKRLELSDGKRLPSTYANFYICNGAVIVPQYGDPMDERALKIIAECFPGRETIGLKSRYIITGGGSFHCLTQQQPAIS